jgi:hypothetical protein
LGRALEYAKRERHAASAFGMREYGTLAQNEKGVLDEVQAEYIEMPHKGRIALLKVPAIGVGWKVGGVSGLSGYELQYVSDPITIDPKADLDRATQTEIGNSVTMLTDASHYWTKQDAVSKIGGAERRYTVISWVPQPKYERFKRDYFLLRTA